MADSLVIQEVFNIYGYFRICGLSDNFNFWTFYSWENYLSIDFLILCSPYDDSFRGTFLSILFFDGFNYRQFCYALNYLKYLDL